ncbi:PD-(D/E)XK nuclease family protein, partial [Oscillospiraceae bacterium OttesenSCG-928-F05]|nr:PD-(D/E)XK nuclease family protein [Oscillospiraceae bacterium OttesenSCG-928-F05]
ILSPAQAAAVDPGDILRFFRSPLGERLEKSGHVRREFKFSLLEPAERYYPACAGTGDTVLLQGVCDLFFEEAAGLVIVDFKSDRVTEATQAARAENYRPQLEAYARALEEITGKPVAARALYFFATASSVEI